MKRRQFLSYALMMPALLALNACHSGGVHTKLPQGSKVIALGDSLTFGYGANPDQSYPMILKQKTGWDLVNMGVNGDKTQDVLNRLASVTAQNPKLVLLGIGGNDVLKKIPSDETKKNLLTIIETFKKTNTALVLIAQPYLSVSAMFGKATDNPIYKEVAQALDVDLFEKAWSQILSDKTLKSDQIHANAQGYQKFAEMLYEFLQELGYA